MKNEDLEKHINALKVLIEKEQYEEAVDYYVDNISEKINVENNKEDLLELISFLEIKEVPELLLICSIVYRKLKNYIKAIEIIDRVIEIKPNYAKAYNSKGIIFYNLNDYDKALKALDKSISLNDNFSNAYNSRANTYAKLRENTKALRDYDKAIELNPNLGTLYYNRGIFFQSQKEYKKALNDFTDCIKLGDNYFFAYYNRGDIYKELEDHDNAIKDFTIFSELIDDYYWKAQALEQIKELQEEKGSDEIKNVNDYIESIKNALLFKETFITHYTSIEGAKVLLLDTTSSFRMSEANYMNDTTEGERLKEVIIKKENLDGLTKISYIEKPFLGSFVDDKKCNDLTLWRMYAKSDGIDGRGCAITMDKEELIAVMMNTFIDEEYLKNNSEFSSSTKKIEDVTISTNKTAISNDEFGFYKVAYLNEEGKCIGRDKVSKSVNKALEGLKVSFENILNKDDKELLKIALTRLSEIEYLFKGIEYQHESEVRLILSKTGKGKHIKVDTSDYFEVPRVYLNIGNILSAVESITIGPKVERPKEWASAFNYNFLEKGMEESKVYISRLPYK